jgi:hypothetical protein
MWVPPPAAGEAFAHPAGDILPNPIVQRSSIVAVSVRGGSVAAVS